jgi:hypothetical protein
LHSGRRRGTILKIVLNIFLKDIALRARPKIVPELFLSGITFRCNVFPDFLFGGRPFGQTAF